MMTKNIMNTRLKLKIYMAYNFKEQNAHKNLMFFSVYVKQYEQIADNNKLYFQNIFDCNF